MATLPVYPSDPYDLSIGTGYYNLLYFVYDFIINIWTNASSCFFFKWKLA